MTKKTGDGVLRQIERLANHRKAQAERLKDAKPQKISRQQRRWAARKGQ